jgi:hypothetical protein
LLILARCVFALDGLLGLRPTLYQVLVVVAVLLACACYWSVRGRQLLKSRRLFASC